MVKKIRLPEANEQAAGFYVLSCLVAQAPNKMMHQYDIVVD
jgi:hypothetical protein